MVTVPASVKAGQMFKVSVPMPEVAKAEPQNKFTKSCIVALSEYSNAYDDWCQSEGKMITMHSVYFDFLQSLLQTVLLDIILT